MTGVENAIIIFSNLNIVYAPYLSVLEVLVFLNQVTMGLDFFSSLKVSAFCFKFRKMFMLF